MKKISIQIISLVMAAVMPLSAFGQGYYFARPASGGGGSTWTEEITDAFSSAGAPPSGWSEINGSWEATGGILQPDDSVANRVIVSATSTASSASQFVKFQFAASTASSFDGLVLRHAGGNVRYVIRYDKANSQLHLRYCSGANAYTTFHTISSVTFSASDYFAATVTGTDAATEFKIWKNPSAGTTPDLWGAATYTINAATPWTLTPTYHDSGTGVGLYSGSASFVSQFDNFSAGSKP
jgi:hypothetical protein